MDIKSDGRNKSLSSRTFFSPTSSNLFQTAVHEIGHLLGLAHSNDPRSTMYPQNKKFDVKYGLADDDVRGIRRLYPPKSNKNVPTDSLNNNSV